MNLNFERIDSNWLWESSQALVNYVDRPTNILHKSNN